MTNPGTSPSDDHLPPEPHDGVDAADNAEARTYESDQSPSLSRAANSGPPPTDAPAEGETPDIDGTQAGDALAGVHISAEDAAAAVPGDEGPEHGGVRRNT